MKKLMKLILLSAMVVSAFALGGIIADKQQLSQGIVRLHVIANSDSQQDQVQKLQVRDAIVTYLQPKMQQMTDKQQVMEYLAQSLQQIETAANATLEKIGSAHRATVKLDKSLFDTRDYETFSLPAGVYDALRVQIGAAEGKNWWCVVFPTLCLPATSDEFAATAAASGFDEELSNTLQKTNGYEIRFFLLDCFGKLENFFHK